MDGWMDGQRGGRMDGMGLVIIGHRSSKKQIIKFDEKKPSCEMKICLL